MAERLSTEARKSALTGLPGWTDTPGREAIARTFIFKDFNEAFGFMSRVAMFTRRWKWFWQPMTPVGSRHSISSLQRR